MESDSTTTTYTVSLDSVPMDPDARYLHITDFL